MKIILISSIVIFSLINLLKSCNGVSRVPSPRDHVLCRVKLSKVIEEINENNDSSAHTAAYFNKTGALCRTYCQIISHDSEYNGKTYSFDSPSFEGCGPYRYCNEYGKCLKPEMFEEGSMKKNKKEKEKEKEREKEETASEE